jgi:hypothetical protein
LLVSCLHQHVTVVRKPVGQRWPIWLTGRQARSSSHVALTVTGSCAVPRWWGLCGEFCALGFEATLT